MQELLELILTNITTHPDEVSIVTSTEDGMTVFTISVHPDDMGRVIGKNGKVIRAIRSLAHVVGIRRNEKYRVNVAEVEEDHGEEDTDEEMIVQETPAPEEVMPDATTSNEVEAMDEPVDELIADTIQIPPAETEDKKS